MGNALSLPQSSPSSAAIPGRPRKSVGSRLGKSCPKRGSSEISRNRAEQAADKKDHCRVICAKNGGPDRSSEKGALTGASLTCRGAFNPLEEQKKVVLKEKRREVHERPA